VSPLFDAALRSSALHALEHALWVASALLLWWPVVGADPTPHPWSYPTRLLALFLAMPAASFLSLAIFSASAPWYPTYASAPPPWGPGALASQRDAAVVMWLLTGLGQVVAMLLVAAAWKRHDDARQRRLEARLDAASGAVAP
jgi:cytochrome c oxidase assembly factor CtaG